MYNKTSSKDKTKSATEVFILPMILYCNLIYNLNKAMKLVTSRAEHVSNQNPGQM